VILKLLFNNILANFAYDRSLQGKESDTFEKAASAILAVQLDGQVGGAAKQVRNSLFIDL